MFSKNYPVSCGQYALKKNKERHFSNWDETQKRLHRTYVAVFQSPVQTSFHQLYFLSAHNGNIIRIRFLTVFHPFIVLFFCGVDKQRNKWTKNGTTKESQLKLSEWIELRFSWLGDESGIFWNKWIRIKSSINNTMQLWNVNNRIQQ